MLSYYFLYSKFFENCNRAGWNKRAGWPKKLDLIIEQAKNVRAGWNFFSNILSEHALLLGTSKYIMFEPYEMIFD